MHEAVAILKREKDVAIARADAIAVELRELRATIKTIDDAIAVLTGHRPDPKPMRVAAGELKSLILQTLTAYGQTGATAREIAESVSLTRSSTSEASVSSTLSRMKNEDNTCDNRQGKWYLKVVTALPELRPMREEAAEHEEPRPDDEYANFSNTPCRPPFDDVIDSDEPF